MTSQDVLERLGSPRRSFWGGSLSVRSPIDGAEIARISGDAPVRHAGGHRSRQKRFRRLARGSRAPPRRARAPPRRGIARLEGGARRARDPGGGQDRFGGSRRSAGDDRHLRFRRRPFAAVARSRHRLGAPRAPHDGDLASARALRGHFGVQFSGRGLVLERGARARLRRSRHLEAVGEDAALGAGDHEDPRPRAQALRRRRARRARADRHRRTGDRRGPGRIQARARRLGHRLDPHGLDRRPEGRRAFRPGDSGARRQQRDDRRALGRSRHGGAGDRLLRGRHGRAALHLAAPAHRPSFDPRRPDPPPRKAYASLAIGDPRERAHARRAAHRPRRARQDAGRA